MHQVLPAREPGDRASRSRVIAGFSERFTVDVDDGVGADREPRSGGGTENLAARVKSSRLKGRAAGEGTFVVRRWYDADVEPDRCK
jgi:hypothetical protein